ncbi:MAG: hypothetical protein ACQRW7_04730 [Caulobacterales bacterium]|uniref:hypothetical protein n=1 Tax=Glycocaulis sp. TaxID=1969725 RepID=UPI003FA1007A
MGSMIGDIRSGFRGIFALLAFKPDWRQHFDVSVDGFARSFLAALYALPAFILLMLAANHVLAGLPGGDTAQVSVLEAFGQYARIWLLFPVIAFIVVKALGLKTGFSAWIVVHNWAVFVLLHVQAFIWLMAAAGLANAELLGLLLAFYQVIRLFVHWRVAAGALGLHWGLAAGAACIPLVVDALIVYGLTSASGG